MPPHACPPMLRARVARTGDIATLDNLPLAVLPLLQQLAQLDSRKGNDHDLHRQRTAVPRRSRNRPPGNGFARRRAAEQPHRLPRERRRHHRYRRHAHARQPQVPQCRSGQPRVVRHRSAGVVGPVRDSRYRGARHGRGAPGRRAAVPAAGTRRHPHSPRADYLLGHRRRIVRFRRPQRRKLHFGTTIDDR